jgi:hypothetical protein
LQTHTLILGYYLQAIAQYCLTTLLCFMLVTKSCRIIQLTCDYFELLLVLQILMHWDKCINARRSSNPEPKPKLVRFFVRYVSNMCTVRLPLDLSCNLVG